jgi:predicted nucleotidyltransferase
MRDFRTPRLGVAVRHEGSVKHAARAPVSRDVLLDLGIAGATARLLRFFVVHESDGFHLRQLQRLLRVGSASLQRDLAHLTSMGAIACVVEGRVLRYRAQISSRVWAAVRLLLEDSADIVPLLRDALCDVDGILVALLFGSFAHGTSHPDSDVDLFVLESPLIDRSALNVRLFDVGRVLNREVNAVRYSMQELGERLGNEEHAAHSFVHRVFMSPLHVVAGDLHVVEPLLLAAGRVRHEAVVAS